jgi:hypothetical protein
MTRQNVTKSEFVELFLWFFMKMWFHKILIFSLTCKMHFWGGYTKWLCRRIPRKEGRIEAGLTEYFCANIQKFQNKYTNSSKNIPKLLKMLTKYIPLKKLTLPWSNNIYHNFFNCYKFLIYFCVFIFNLVF